MYVNIDSFTRYECLERPRIKRFKFFIDVHPLCARKDYVICSLVDTFVVLSRPSAAHLRPSCSSCIRSVSEFVSLT